MTPLAKILMRETGLVSRFVSLLDKEQDVLIAGNPDALNEINLEKLALVSQLNQIGSERSQITDLTGTASDRERMRVWLGEHPQEKDSAVLWIKLLSLAQEAKIRHELNGKLIGIHLQQTTDAIAALTQHRQNQALYGSNGQTAPATGSRIVDSA